MNRKFYYLFLAALLLVSCNKEMDGPDSHLINRDNGKVISEKIERGPLEFIGNYDEYGNLSSISVSDDNLKFIANIQNGQMAAA